MNELNDRELIKLFDTRIRKIYVEKGLISLRFDHDGERSFAPQGVDLHEKYYQIVQEDAPLEEGEDTENVQYFDRWNNFDEFINISDQIIYFTAHLYLYRPLINNPLEDAFHMDGYEHIIYPNYQNAAAKRFDTYSDTLAEKIYAFWMRLAHLLNRYLPYPLNRKVNSVDFTRVMDLITQKVPQYHQNEGYIWLKKFQDNEQSELNERRKFIVHHVTSGTTFAEDHRKSLGYEEMKELIDERCSRPEFFKKHLFMTFTALEKALDLITEFPEPVPLRKYNPKISLGSSDRQ